MGPRRVPWGPGPGAPAAGAWAPVAPQPKGSAKMYACFAEHMAVHLGMGMHARISVCMAVCMVICMAVCMVLGMALCVNLCMAVCMNLNMAESMALCTHMAAQCPIFPIRAIRLIRDT